jgi:enoyl-CoA hydratase/carnithine racemase
MRYETIRLSVEGPTATLTLNRPGSLNALSPLMVGELASAVAEVDGRREVKVLVVRGEGRAFCAGADLTFLGQAFDDPTALTGYLKDLNSLLFRLEELPVPVVAVVHGYALAGGLELLLACDLAIAAEDAQIGDQHANLGLMPGGGSTQRLPQKLGLGRAMELLFTGRWLSGREAEEWGLVTRAVPASKLDQELEALLATLRDKSRDGLGWIKSAARAGQNMALREGVAFEGSAFAHLVATSPDPREGIRAFKEKRRPAF